MNTEETKQPKPIVVMYFPEEYALIEGEKKLKPLEAQWI